MEKVKLFIHRHCIITVASHFYSIKGVFKKWHESTDILLAPPPLNLTIRKGSKNVALTRAWAKIVVNDALSISLQDWLKHTWIPDEHFYSTLASVKSYDMKVNHSLVPSFRSDLDSLFRMVQSSRICHATAKH